MDGHAEAAGKGSVFQAAAHVCAGDSSGYLPRADGPVLLQAPLEGVRTTLGREAPPCRRRLARGERKAPGTPAGGDEAAEVLLSARNHAEPPLPVNPLRCAGRLRADLSLAARRVPRACHAPPRTRALRRGLASFPCLSPPGSARGAK